MKNVPGVHVDTDRQVLVEIVLLFTRIRERDIAECNVGGRQLGHIAKVERELFRLQDLFDQTGSLHLVDNLLLRLGLLDQVGVGTGGRDELCPLVLVMMDKTR